MIREIKGDESLPVSSYEVNATMDARSWGCKKLGMQGAAMERGMMGSGWGRVRSVGAGGVVLCLLALTGCGAFFQCEGKASCGTGGSGGGSGTTTDTGDYVYTTNVAGNLNAINGFSISSTGTMTALAGSPYSVTPQPSALVVGIGNTYLYAASASTKYPGIYVYSLASSGVPTAANSGTAVTPPNLPNTVYSMAVSPDGGWLFTIEDEGTGPVIGEYQLNSGIPAFAGSLSLPLYATCSATLANCNVAVAPTGSFVIAVAGTYGAIAYPFSSSNGGVSGYAAPLGIPTGSTSVADFSVAVDKFNYAYISQTSSITSYLITNTNGVLSRSNNSLTNTSFANSENPHSIVTAGGYVYTADPGTSKTSAFSSTNGSLPAVGTATSGPTSEYSIGVDSSGNYLVAGGSSSSIGVQVFSITDGVLANLNQSSATNTGSVFPIAIALTH